MRQVCVAIRCRNTAKYGVHGETWSYSEGESRVS